MKRIDAILMVCAGAIGVISAYSSNRWMSAFDRASIEVRIAKEELLTSGDLRDLHHRIYKKVGEYAWETRVKPRFMSDVTYATIRESGDILPETSDVINWVRGHPEEAHRLMVAASELQAAFLQ